MTEVNYRTALMDREDLHIAISGIERRLNDLRDAMIDSRDLSDSLVGFAAESETIAATAREVLALNDNKHP